MIKLVAPSNSASTSGSDRIQRGALLKRLAILAAVILPLGCESARDHSRAFSIAEPVIEIIAPPTQRPAHEGFVAVEGAQLEYWDTGGPGAPIILLHAATGSAESWIYQQPVFADAGYRVIAYSRRGHGRSTSEPLDPQPAHAADLHALMQELNIPRAHIVSTAAGSIVAADFALSYPERIQSIVFAASLISFRDPLVADARHRLSLEEVRRLPPAVLELSASYRYANPEGAARWAEIESRAHHPDAPAVPALNQVTFEALAQLETPMLLMGGDADLYLPPSLLQDLAARLPSAQVVLLRGAAHAVFWEQPRAFNDAVLEFLTQHN